ncbi:hypothetical protein MHYP_G00065000 [Metynnis hypsauchen]
MCMVGCGVQTQDVWKMSVYQRPGSSQLPPTRVSLASAARHRLGTESRSPLTHMERRRVNPRTCGEMDRGVELPLRREGREQG